MIKFTANTVFKSLRDDMGSHHAFPLPGSWQQKAAWVGPVRQDERQIKAHSWGLHLAKEDFLIYWIGARNFIAEYKGDRHETRDVVAAEFARVQQEIYFPNKSLADLAVKYCETIKDFGELLEFDWTIAKTMQKSFSLSKAFLKAREDMHFPQPRAVKALAKLCDWNADLRMQDARNSFQYVYGCEAVAHASRALALLPQMQDKDNVKNIQTLKQIAYDVRKAISLAVEEHYYRAEVNGAPVRPLPKALAKWVSADESALQPHRAAFVTAGKWQNDLLLKKASLTP